MHSSRGISHKSGKKHGAGGSNSRPKKANLTFTTGRFPLENIPVEPILRHGCILLITGNAERMSCRKAGNRDRMNGLKRSNHFFLQTRAVPTALLFLVFFLVSLFAVQQSEAEENEQVLLNSGIHYPGGFDSNTVGTVEGRVSEYCQPKRGPVRFQLESRREIYTVLASPAWYWDDLGADIPDGTSIRVRGSKSLGKDGKLYIIAQEMKILSSEQSLVFRSKDGFPLWKGSRRGATGGRGGYGSSQGGKDGMSRGRR